MTTEPRPDGFGPAYDLAELAWLNPDTLKEELKFQLLHVEVARTSGDPAFIAAAEARLAALEAEAAKEERPLWKSS